MILLRSLLFNALFYLNTGVWLIAALPAFVLPYRVIIAIAKAWGRVSRTMLRVIAGLDYEIRGVEKIPTGPIIVAAKHQSAWETFALLPLFDNPTFIIKRELQWIPVFGWFTIKAGMVPVDRRAGLAALKAMTARAHRELSRGRQLVIFPEGTRRAPGEEPRYKPGVAQLYLAQGVPCVPIALNSGLFWPRRSLLRRPGRILVQVLDPIAPGLDRDAFLTRLQDAIETATARLIKEAKDAAGP